MATTRDYPPDLYPNAAVRARNGEQEPAVDYQAQRRPPKSRVDEWMEVEFKFGGSRIKRKALALILLGAPATAPVFFMIPSLFTMNTNTFSGAVDDVFGTGAALCLFLTLLITPMVTVTGQRWFVPLRKWYGIMVACCGIGDAIIAGLTDQFAGGFLGVLTGHIFELMGTFMVTLLIPLLIISNHWAQRQLGRYWKRLQQLTYVIWGLLGLHLALLEGVKNPGQTGSGFPGDGDPIFHQRLYEYCACSLFLLSLRLPPVKQWIAARQREGRNWLVYLTIAPIFALFVLGFMFFLNELIFKGVDAFHENPSNE